MPAAPLDPGVCGRTLFGVLGATSGDDDRFVLVSVEFLGDAADGGR